MQEQDAAEDQNKFSTVGIAMEKQLSYSERTNERRKQPQQNTTSKLILFFPVQLVMYCF